MQSMFAPSANVKSIYPNIQMKHFEYLWMPIKLIPKSFIENHDLQHNTKDGFVYKKIRKIMYGLPQVSVLANQQLKERLDKYGYYKVPHTPGLWKNTLPIQFTLDNDDFGIEYVNKNHVEQLPNALKAHYKVEIEWTGRLYCGSTIEWN